MVHFNIQDDYLDYVMQHPDLKVIVYGAGYYARRNLRYMGQVDYFCDRDAKRIDKVEGIPCLLPEELLEIDERMIILVCVKQKDTADEISRILCGLPINAEVFSFFENTSFSSFDVSTYAYHFKAKDRLRIRIVSAEDGWILMKFARKLQEELNKLGQDVDMDTEEDPTADVNHFVHFERLKKIYNRFITVRTTMITHVDSMLLRDMVYYQAQNNAVGICMSSDTLGKLSSWGIPRDKLCYVNPAQDGDLSPKKIVLGIIGYCDDAFGLNTEDDWIVRICEKLDHQIFRLKILGKGWNLIVDQLRKLWFDVEYTMDFDKETYAEWLGSIDYELFYGNDLGYMDAMAAGIKIIAKPYGSQLAVGDGVTYPCERIADFVRVLQGIQSEKKEIMDSVKDWTWENYARKHLEIWQYLTKTKPLKELYGHQSEYLDGIFSLLISDNRL